MDDGLAVDVIGRRSRDRVIDTAIGVVVAQHATVGEVALRLLSLAALIDRRPMDEIARAVVERRRLDLG
jgi:AmiR/NasT family two-component response regulator